MHSFIKGISFYNGSIHYRFLRLLYVGVMLLSASFSLMAQKKSSADSSAVYVFKPEFHTLNRWTPVLVDTMPVNNQRYDAVISGDRFFAALGNTGLASLDLLPDFVPEAGFRYGRKAFDAYRYTVDNVPWYQSRKPFTEILWVSGPGKENNLQAMHSQNFYKGLTGGINYRLTSSPGAYQRQKVSDHNVAITLRYFSPDKRYGGEAAFVSNKFIVQENGGIANREMFEGNTESNRSVIPVNLQLASNTERNMRVMLSQFYELGFSRQQKIKADTLPAEQIMVADSLKTDTIAQDTIANDKLLKALRKFTRFGRIVHTFTYGYDWYEYEDGNPNSGFYSNILIDSLKTRDSVHIQRFENEVGWTNASYLLENKFPVELYAGIKHQAVAFRADSLQKNFNQVILKGSAKIVLPRGFQLSGDAFIIKGDYNDGDLGIAARIDLPFAKKLLLSGGLNLGSSKPDFYSQYHYSNHFYWNNDFARSEYYRLWVNMKWFSLDAGFEYYLLNEAVFYDVNGRPSQKNGETSLLRLNLKHVLKWRKFTAENHVIIQKPTDTTVLRLPEILARSTWYFTLSVFKGALIFQPGIDVSYNTSYYSNAYMPATGVFYHQNTETTGNFFNADIYANFKIKRARIFVRYRHVNSHWGPYDYYAAPGYPLKDAGLNFGVNWRFYD